jgi:hypothetical protein
MKCCCCEEIHIPDPIRINFFPESTSVDICDNCFVDILHSNLEKQQMKIKLLQLENEILRKSLNE